MDMPGARVTLGPVAEFVNRLKAVSFIENVSLAPHGKAEGRFDGVLTLRTNEGTFKFAVVLKRSYLDRASAHAITALGASSRRAGRPLLLLARYIPRPMGEQLIAADVNFVDLAGNIHVALGNKYACTILGKAETQKHERKRAPTAAQVQVEFLLAAEPDAATWPVRQIAARAGISKSKAAQIRQQLKETKQIQGRAKDRERLLLSGYAEFLRPKLFLGRFRSRESPEDFVAHLADRLAPRGVRFSLTGGAAADLLQHFYRGPETALFLDQWIPEIQKRLQLLPDRQGPVIVMRAFGEPVFWKTQSGVTVAHPWLIYAELMHSEDPRAHEAAEELRRDFLVK
jgi:hypothetical protein